MGKLESTIRCINVVRAKTDGVILFCSLGKDSLVTLDLIYPRFNRIVCVFMYFVKGLEHIERWVRWVQNRYPRVEFLQIPHWNLSYLLRGGLYCVPNPSVRLMRLTDVVSAIRRQTGLEFAFFGMKKCDGMNRNLMLKGYAANDYVNNGMAYPLAEWNQRDVLAYMRQRKLPPPVRYSLKASSGVGFNLDCFLWLRENCPRDLERIYEVFPLAERVLWEYDQQQKKENV